jgi:hypothetical protein
MQITATVANYNIGGTPGNFINPQVVTLQTWTSAVSLSAKLVNGAGQYADQQSGKLRVWYGTSAHSLTAAAGAVAIREARYLDIVPSPATSGTALVSSLIEPVRGGYLYFWFETPAFSPVAVVSVSVCEI